MTIIIAVYRVYTRVNNKGKRVSIFHFGMVKIDAESHTRGIQFIEPFFGGGAALECKILATTRATLVSLRLMAGKFPCLHPQAMNQGG